MELLEHDFHNDNATSESGMPTSLIGLSSDHDEVLFGGSVKRYPSQTVLLWIAGFLQSGCGYYIPMSAIFLWRSIGIGAFIMGIVYMQYLYSSYFFFDGPVAAEVSRIIKEQHTLIKYTIKNGGGGGHNSNPYPIEAQDFASFFFVLFTHFTVYKTWSESVWRATVIVTSFFMYIGVLAWSYGFDFRLIIMATFIGAAIGTVKVLLFDAIVCPLCLRLCSIGLLKRR